MELRKIIINTLLLSAITLGCSLSSNAQTKEDREALRRFLGEEEIKFVDNRREATKFDYGQMDLALSQNKYDVFFNIVSQVKANEELVKWLEIKSFDGHVPVFWILADINSKEKNGEDAHKWLYIATIATEQDVELCGDKAAEGHTKQILRNFPDTVHYSRSTPFYIDGAMRKAYEFLSNQKERPGPDWVCSIYKTNDKKSKRRAKPVSRGKWDRVRAEVLEKFAGDFKPKIEKDDIFKDLEERDMLDRKMEALELKSKK